MSYSTHARTRSSCRSSRRTRGGRRSSRGRSLGGRGRSRGSGTRAGARADRGSDGPRLDIDPANVPVLDPSLVDDAENTDVEVGRVLYGQCNY
jgi:hypothetical protein